jgi:hypothetical protein
MHSLSEHSGFVLLALSLFQNLLFVFLNQKFSYKLSGQCSHTANYTLGDLAAPNVFAAKEAALAAEGSVGNVRIQR